MEAAMSMSLALTATAWAGFWRESRKKCIQSLQHFFRLNEAHCNQQKTLYFLNRLSSGLCSSNTFVQGDVQERENCTASSSDPLSGKQTLFFGFCHFTTQLKETRRKMGRKRQVSDASLYITTTKKELVRRWPWKDLINTNHHWKGMFMFSIFIYI